MRKPLPLRLVSWVARQLGREKFHEALRRAFAVSLERGPQRVETRRVLERVLRHSGKSATPEQLRSMMAELVYIHADIRATVFSLEPGCQAEFLKRIELPALAQIQRLRAAGKGIILVSPHFGNIALAMAGVAFSGIPLNTLLISARPYRWYESYGLKVLDAGGGAVDSVRALAANEAVMLLADIDFFPDNRTADFFGAPVHPPQGPARLALASGAPILPIYAVHLGKGRYRLEHDAALVPGLVKTQEELEGAILASMERWISRYPSQWAVFRDVWDYKRYDRLNQRRMALLAYWRRIDNLVEKLLP